MFKADWSLEFHGGHSCKDGSRNVPLKPYLILALVSVVPLVGMLSHNWWGHIPRLWVQSLVPAWTIPCLGALGRQPINASLSHWHFSLFFPLFLPFSLKVVKKNVLMKIKKNKTSKKATLSLSVEELVAQKKKCHHLWQSFLEQLFFPRRVAEVTPHKG